MKSEPFNPVQLHLLKMFSYAKDERALEEIRKSLTAYFAQRVEEDMVRRGSVLVSFLFGAMVFREKNLKSKAVDLALVLIGMIFLYLGSR